jgi:hypothetical protein
MIDLREVVLFFSEDLMTTPLTEELMLGDFINNFTELFRGFEGNSFE